MPARAKPKGEPNAWSLTPLGERVTEQRNLNAQHKEITDVLSNT